MTEEKNKKKNDGTEITWRAAEYDHFEKSGGWYFIVGGVSLILLIIALWQGNFFFGIFILLAGIMVVTFGNRRPDVLEFGLTQEGCNLGRGNFFNYGQLENFSLRNRPGRLDEIIFKKRTSFNPYVRIPVDSQTAEKIRIFLVQKLPEEEYKDSILDILVDFLGF